MDGILTPLRRRRITLFWLVPMLGLLVFGGLQAWTVVKRDAAARLAAETLLARLDADPRVTPEEYGTWKELAGADPDVRVAAVRLFQDAKYAPVLLRSEELVGRNVIGADRDGAVSRRLAEELICDVLEAAPATGDRQLPFYLVPWLNPAALDSLHCASILTRRLLAAAPGTFGAGANLLARVLAALPPEQARPFVGAIADAAARADAGGVDVLFSALRHVRGADYPTEFAAALPALAARIASAQTPAAIASLFDSIDFLKYAVTAGELEPVIDAAVEQMLARNDSDLTREIYFTLTDLKTSHPGTSFGRRADYLMQGINVYSDALEIYDYSRVLALNERYPADDAALARELVNGIRNLDEGAYLSGILPYCKRFLETGAALPYAEFLAGAQLLVEQLNNPRFIFQRPCLLDSGLVQRIAPQDRGTLAASVVAALANMEDAGSNRIATAIELLGMLGSALDSTQTAQLADLVMAMAAAETDGWSQARLVRAAAAAANLDFPPGFYSELFALVIATSDADGRPVTVPPAFLEKLSATQRAFVVDNTLAALAALSSPLEDAEALATQASLLMVMKPWLARADVERAAGLLMTAMEDARSIPVFAALARVLIVLEPQLRGQSAAVHAAWFRHVAASDARADLAELFQAGGSLATLRAGDTAGQATVKNAAIRFLEQFVPGDSRAAAVRGILARPPAESELPQVTAAEGTRERREQTRQRAQAISRSTRMGTRVLLEPQDVERLAARYVRVLADERVSVPVADYALSLETLALASRPGALDPVLAALRQRLDASGDVASHDVLVSMWISVESATNAERGREQRLPLYQEVMLLPLTTAASRALLVAKAGEIAGQDFAGDVWTALAWAPPAPARP